MKILFVGVVLGAAASAATAAAFLSADRFLILENGIACKKYDKNADCGAEDRVVLILRPDGSVGWKPMDK